MKITFRQLDAFRTVLSTGTVTEAAATLGISQPAVSRLLSDLEAELGFDLFRRSGRMLEATEEARLLLVEIKQAISGLEHIKDAAASIRSFAHARLSIVTTPTFSTLVAPDLIRRFSEIHPKSHVRLEVESADDSVEWMVSSGFDFGIVSGETSNPALSSLTILQEKAFCVLPEGNVLTELKTIRAADLADHNFVSYLTGTPFRRAVDVVFDDAGITRRLHCEARTTDAICRLVGEGLGVSVVGGSVEFLANNPRIVAVPFEPVLPFSATLVWSKRAPLSAVAESFLKGAQNVARLG